jgi:hypothetical protein
MPCGDFVLSRYKPKTCLMLPGWTFTITLVAFWSAYSHALLFQRVLSPEGEER